MKETVKETAKETAKKSAFKIKQEYIDDFLKPYGFDADNLPHNLNVFMDKLSFGKKHQIKSLISQETGEKGLLINRGGRYILEDVEYYDDNKTPKKIYMTLIDLQSEA